MVGGTELFSLGCYEGLLRDAVTTTKFRGHRAVGLELARFAAESIEPLRLRFEDPPCVFAVPGSKVGQKKRGFSLPAMVADEICRKTGWHHLDKNIVKVFPLAEKSSQGLDIHHRWSRHQSILESLSVPLTRRGLLIVDDVVTTGATISANVETARNLGFETVVCFALAVKPACESDL